MAYPSFIGARYLNTKSKHSISVITSIAVAGVALGVASLLVVVSVMSGFNEEITNKILGINAHVLVISRLGNTREYKDIMKKTEELAEVRGVAPFICQHMMISKGQKTSGVMLKGTDPDLVGTVLELPNYIIEGGLEGLRVPGFAPGEIPAPVDDDVRKEVPGIVLGKILAQNLGAGVGDEVQVTTSTAGLRSLGLSPNGDVPHNVKFRVSGIFYAGFSEYDTNFAFIDYYQSQRFFGFGDSVLGVEIALHDEDLAPQVAKQLEQILGGARYEIVDWETLNHQMFVLLMQQKVVLMSIVALLVGVSAFNIIATLVMMVFDKRRDIAILKSMGATRWGISAVFVHVGTVVGIMGIAIGLAVGFGVCLLLLKVGWSLDPKVYMIDHLPVRIEFLDYALTGAVALGLCLIATLLPSLSAAKLKPVDGIQH